MNNKPILKKTRTMQVNESKPLDGTKTMVLCLKHEEWYNRLSDYDKKECYEAFKSLSEGFDFVDRCSLIMPNTLAVQQETIRWLKKAGM